MSIDATTVVSCNLISPMRAWLKTGLKHLSMFLVITFRIIILVDLVDEFVANVAILRILFITNADPTVGHEVTV